MQNMKEIHCRDLSEGSDCHFVARGGTGKEAKMMLWDHIENNHPEVVNGLDEMKKNDMDKRMDKLLMAS